MDELRKIVNEATPGPWKRDGREGLTRFVYTEFDAHLDDPGADIAKVLYHDPDADFIATFDPQVVEALLDVVEGAYTALEYDDTEDLQAAVNAFDALTGRP